MKWKSVIGCLGLLIFFLFIPLVYSAEDRPFTESVIIFNTICAKCHEAQCSGRLSFNDSYNKSTAHILRYYAQASGKEGLQKELFNILHYMKAKCAYYPMKASVPIKKIWEEEVLVKFMTMIKRNYFIPVGNFSPGLYRIKLELDEDVKVSVNFISGKFDMIIDECYQSKERQINITTLIEEPGEYYFRMYPREAVSLIRLEITQIDNEAK